MCARQCDQEIEKIAQKAAKTVVEPKTPKRVTSKLNSKYQKGQKGQKINQHQTLKYLQQTLLAPIG